MGTSSPLPALGATQGGVRFQLVRSEGGASPFVVLHEGRFSRLLLAELVVDGGGAVTRFAWKVQSDAYKPPAHGSGHPLTNPDIDDLWRREIDDLAAVSSPHVIAPLPAPAGLRESLPIAFCTRTGSYFHPVCGRTGELLTVCRDDDFLADCGLVKYSQDTWRYLYGGGAARTSRTFYRVPGANAERPRNGTEVKIGGELFRGFAELVHAPADAPAVQRAAAALPCLSCPHRAECFPAGAPAGRLPAEDHLRTVSFYDFRALPLPLLDVDYDQLCDLLGGAPFAEIVQSGSAAQRQLLQRHTAAFTNGPQWLFAGDAQRFPREVLRTKLTAFQEVCRGLGALHVATGRPHFGIAPQNVMARCLPAGRGCPARWSFEVQLVDLGSPVRAKVPGRGADLPPLLEPGPELREDLRMRPYCPPDLQGVDGQGSTLTVQFRAAEPDGERVRLPLDAQGLVNLKRFRAGDQVCIATGGNDGDGLWAQITEVRAKGVAAVVVLAANDPRARLAGRTIDANCTFFRSFGPPVDLHGLGMLLLRTLLANDQQSIDDVEDVVGKVLRRLRDEMPSGAVDPAVVKSRLLQALQAKEHRDRFASRNVLFARTARDACQRAGEAEREPLDRSVWHPLLGIAFQMLTQFKGFSYSDSHAEGSPYLLRQVENDIEAVRRRLAVDLFAGEARDAAISGACDDVLGQLRNELLAGGDSAKSTSGGASGGGVRAEKGFRLSVQKDGDPAPVDYDFTREQVTIGRREVDNLIRLNDPMVSSAHAVIEKQPEGYVVIDRNSLNGTEVDGIRLPGDVAQPLQDGSVIRIRPFTLVFHAGSDQLNVTAVVRTVSPEEIVDQVHAEFAAKADAPPAEQREAVRQVLLRARPSVGASALLATVESIGKRVRPAAPGAPGAAAPALDGAFFASAHKAMAQLAETLVGAGDFKKADDVERFAQKLGQFVTGTTRWVESALLLRRELGRQLELGATSTGVAGVRTAADVQKLTLDWHADAPTPERAGSFLGKFFDDVQATMEGLLAGAQTVRRAIRDQLDPERLVDKVGRGLMTNMAAGSALWKHYVEVFHDVTEGKTFELELDRLLQKSLQERRSGPR